MLSAACSVLTTCLRFFEDVLCSLRLLFSDTEESRDPAPRGDRPFRGPCCTWGRAAGPTAALGTFGPGPALHSCVKLWPLVFGSVPLSGVSVDRPARWADVSRTCSSPPLGPESPLGSTGLLAECVSQWWRRVCSRWWLLVWGRVSDWMSAGARHFIRHMRQTVRYHFTDETEVQRERNLP